MPLRGLEYFEIRSLLIQYLPILYLPIHQEIRSFFCTFHRIGYFNCWYIQYKAREWVATDTNITCAIEKLCVPIYLDKKDLGYHVGLSIYIGCKPTIDIVFLSFEAQRKLAVFC